MLRGTKAGTVTFTEFVELLADDQKADLIDGVIHMASPESLDHNELMFWLGRLLHRFVDKRHLGHVTLNKIAYRLGDHTAPEPDVAFVRTERLGILRKTFVDGPPDLAIELVSPESADRDYESKRLRYETAGVAEYWIIDPEEQSAVFLVRGDSGFEEAIPSSSGFRSRVIPGLELDLRRLWQSPRPDAVDLADEMLSRINKTKPARQDRF